MTRCAAALFSAIILCTTAFPQDQPRPTVGGYGEIHYNEPDGTARGQLDFHRFVLFFGHSFTERISFRSELEIEHTKIEAGAADGGEIALEQAFLDFRISEAFGLRAGILLTPVGLVNLTHEPPTFNGVERPAVDRVIIPTTWREAGAGMYGSPAEGVQYQLYLTAGLRSAGFDAANGIRGGRQAGFESDPVNPSLTGRIDYAPAAGLFLGASFFAGSANEGIDSIGSAAVTLWSADVRYSADRFLLRGVVAVTSISDAALINRAFGGNVADRLYGYYLEGAYNMLPLLVPETDADLFLFLRYEKYNTQARTTGFAPLAQYDRNDIVLGLTLKPVYNVAVKSDYTWMRNALNHSGARNTGQFNLGLGYYF
jgi:hypothetical protein